MARNRRDLGTTLRRTRLQVLDGRSRLGRLWCDSQRQLIEDLGGEDQLSPAQAHMIACAADHVVKIASLLPRALGGDTIASRALDQANEDLRRALAALGIKSKTNGRSEHLGDHLARHYGKPERAA